MRPHHGGLVATLDKLMLLQGSNSQGQAKGAGGGADVIGRGDAGGLQQREVGLCNKGEREGGGGLLLHGVASTSGERLGKHLAHRNSVVAVHGCAVLDFVLQSATAAALGDHLGA